MLSLWFGSRGRRAARSRRVLPCHDAVEIHDRFNELGQADEDGEDTPS